MENHITNKAVEIVQQLKKDFCKNDAAIIIEIAKILIEKTNEKDYWC